MVEPKLASSKMKTHVNVADTPDGNVELMEGMATNSEHTNTDSAKTDALIRRYTLLRGTASAFHALTIRTT